MLRVIHDEHSEALQRYVPRLNRSDMPFAEDVVRESLLRLWRKPRSGASTAGASGSGEPLDPIAVTEFGEAAT